MDSWLATTSGAADVKIGVGGIVLATYGSHSLLPSAADTHHRHGFRR